jgi:hypothetical protein
MKKLSLLLIVLMSFIRIGFGQDANPNVKPGQGKGGSCECGEKGVNISTGFDNNSNSLSADGAVDDTWKITAYSNGNGGTAGPINAVKSASGPWAPNLPNAAWIVPANGVSNSGVYDYRYDITVPAGYKAVLKFTKIGADNDVELYVDAIYQKYWSNKDGYAFKPANMAMNPCLIVDELEAGKPIGAGKHNLLFKVRNGVSITGLFVQGCVEFVQLVPECRCPAGWVSNTDQKDGGIIKGNSGCKKQVCVFDKALVPPKNGTVIGDPANPWGFTWENGFYVWGTKANGGAPICTLDGKVIDWNTYKDTQGRGE